MILSLKQAALKDDHSENKHIVFVWIFIDDGLLCLHWLALLRREVDVLDASIVIDTVDISLKRVSQRVHHSHIAILTQQNRLWSQTLVFHLLLLQCSKASYRARHYRPQLLTLKGLLLQRPSNDLIRKRFAGMLPKRVNLVEIRTEVIFSTLLNACISTIIRIRFVKCGLLIADRFLSRSEFWANSLRSLKVCSRSRYSLRVALWVRNVRDCSGILASIVYSDMSYPPSLKGFVLLWPIWFLF